MTDKELAQALFVQPASSMTSASLLIGTVLSVNGSSAVVDFGGATTGGDGAGVELNTTVLCAAGDRVVCTLFGRDGTGKKGIITGVIM